MNAVAISSACLVAAHLWAQEPTEAGARTGLPRLAAPVRIEAGGAPITTTTGHAAPFVVDIDRDGIRDLVVGQFDQGVARVYRNVGTNAAPEFAEFTLLQADGHQAAVKPG